MAEVDYAGEGPVDCAVARALIKACGGVPGTNYSERSNRAPGRSGIDARLPGFNSAARHGRKILVLRDLDNLTCAPALLATLSFVADPKLVFRIAVRTADAWLAADRDLFAKRLRIRPSALPRDLESEQDLKRLLLQVVSDRTLALSGSTSNPADRKRSLAALLAHFAESEWSPRRAAAKSNVPSLETAIDRLSVLVDT